MVSVQIVEPLCQDAPALAYQATTLTNHTNLQFVARKAKIWLDSRVDLSSYCHTMSPLRYGYPGGQLSSHTQGSRSTDWISITGTRTVSPGLGSAYSKAHHGPVPPVITAQEV